MPSLNLLRDLLERVPSRLEQISKNEVESKSSPTAWSPKEELGHLLDSAANNHQRIVRAQSEDKLAMPGYEQNRWVEINGYQRRNWKDLIEGWQALNRQLLAAAWGNTRSESPEYLRMYLRSLRNKIEPNPAQPRYLLTEVGVGYRMIDGDSAP